MVRSVIAALALTFSANAFATTTNYGNQALFQAALPVGYKLINLDAAPYSTNPNGYLLSGVAPALLADGLVSVGYNATVGSGQNFQTPTNRDWIINNGKGFSVNPPLNIAFNFVTPVNGVGALSNILHDGDGGRVRIFSGANLGGTLLGEVNFGAGFGINGFGGIVSSTAIRSVEITCDFNGDLKCGVYDIQFGRTAVPDAPTWALMIGGFGIAGAALRRRSARYVIA